MKILAATTEHIEQLTHLQKQYMDHHVALDSYFNYLANLSEMWRNHAQRLIENPTDYILIAVSDDQILS
jgi:hypothetical protein